MRDHDRISANGWLQAYYDGELGAHEGARVEAHLESCAFCRAELEAFSTLSSLLQEVPAAPVRLSDDRFAAQVGLRLVRRPAPSPAQRAVAIGWRATPVMLVGAYLFVQVASTLTTGLLVLRALGIGQVPFDMLAPMPQGSSTVADVLGTLSALGLDAIGEPLLGTLSAQGLVGGFGLASFAFTVLVGLALWSWLALWQAKQRSASGDRQSVTEME